MEVKRGEGGRGVEGKEERVSEPLVQPRCETRA